MEGAPEQAGAAGEDASGHGLSSGALQPGSPRGRLAPAPEELNVDLLRRCSLIKSVWRPANDSFECALTPCLRRQSALCVSVSGGATAPLAVSFRPYAAGDAPLRIENLCDDLFLKFHQQDCSQVALLSPYQSLLYTWDDPGRARQLFWNIYNNKGDGFCANFAQDGYGEEKVSIHSVRQLSVTAPSSVTSKLSSTLKRLTPAPPPAHPRTTSSSSDDSDSSESPCTPRRTRKDKVVVYWVSFMDNHQRVLALSQDERIAQRYRARIKSERSNYEVYTSLAGIGLSVCINTLRGPRELAYISAGDAPPRWELLVSRRWKPLAPVLAAWLEENYRSDRTECHHKDSINVDFQKMQMTKPFFCELRRSYHPGIWLQFRKSNTYSYLHTKVHQLQVDNQLHDATFPCVFYPSPSTATNQPCFELVALKQHRASIDRDDYKYLKILIREYRVNLDRGFVNSVFDVLNRWKIEEKPAVRLRADLALVHMPLPVVALKSQTSAQKNVVFDYVHLSPIDVVLSLSSRGYNADEPSGTRVDKLGYKEENAPKLFNSNLLEFLFNSWGAFLCDMKDVKIRTSYFEVKNEPITLSALLDRARRHYWAQLLQQFHVLVLGLDVLGNPYGVMADFYRGVRQYYRPSQTPTRVFLRMFEIESRTKYKSGDRASRLVIQLTISVRSDKFLPTFSQAG
ncbi:Vacuolar protein sorting-associated protein 13 [Eumeta japonica]|uniref:Vacuolar protein sorting-associated protein 13 n=1 Tax=Eumeta variegata TaxID=151549 RepID=A0A4C1VNF4_EUMVA|nr:Vacuolar protein sorting-associated protein 13 [Eumeta japonica]